MVSVIRGRRRHQTHECLLGLTAEVHPVLEQLLGLQKIDVGVDPLGHLLDQVVVEMGDVGQAEEVTGLLGRAVDLDRDLHLISRTQPAWMCSIAVAAAIFNAYVAADDAPG
jgi:hypothetical protein